MRNRQWLLAHRPHGVIEDGDFQFVETDAPTPGDGEVLVRTLMLSCDPTQRGWIAGDTYLPAVKIGEVVRSIGAGRIEASNTPDFKVASPLLSITRLVSRRWLNSPPLFFLGRPVAGETVVVSGPPARWARSSGRSPRSRLPRDWHRRRGKCRWLTGEAGFDAAIDYKSENVMARLKELCPEGIDIFFDNVGGDILDAALARLALRCRVVLCGGIANYNASEPPPGPKNYLNLVSRRGRMEGFLVSDCAKCHAEAVAALADWVKEGKIKHRVDVQHGLENAPAALRRLFEGRNEGKQLLRVAE